MQCKFSLSSSLARNHYLEKDTSPQAGIGRYCLGMKDCLKNEQLAKRRSFEGNCEILTNRTIYRMLK